MSRWGGSTAAPPDLSEMGMQAAGRLTWKESARQRKPTNHDTSQSEGAQRKQTKRYFVVFTVFNVGLVSSWVNEREEQQLIVDFLQQAISSELACAMLALVFLIVIDIVFSLCNTFRSQGSNTVCRAAPSILQPGQSNNDPSFYQIVESTSQFNCQAQCSDLQACVDVEYRPAVPAAFIPSRCELWLVQVDTAITNNSGYTCFLKQPRSTTPSQTPSALSLTASSSHSLSKSTSPGPSFTPSSSTSPAAPSSSLLPSLVAPPASVSCSPSHSTSLTYPSPTPSSSSYPSSSSSSYPSSSSSSYPSSSSSSFPSSSLLSNSPSVSSSVSFSPSSSPLASPTPSTSSSPSSSAPYSPTMSASQSLTPSSSVFTSLTPSSSVSLSLSQSASLQYPSLTPSSSLSTSSSLRSKSPSRSSSVSSSSSASSSPLPSLVPSPSLYVLEPTAQSCPSNDSQHASFWPELELQRSGLRWVGSDAAPWLMLVVKLEATSLTMNNQSVLPPKFSFPAQCKENASSVSYSFERTSCSLYFEVMIDFLKDCNFSSMRHGENVTFSAYLQVQSSRADPITGVAYRRSIGFLLVVQQELQVHSAIDVAVLGECDGPADCNGQACQQRPPHTAKVCVCDDCHQGQLCRVDICAPALVCPSDVTLGWLVAVACRAADTVTSLFNAQPAITHVGDELTGSSFSLSIAEVPTIIRGTLQAAPVPTVAGSPTVSTSATASPSISPSISPTATASASTSTTQQVEPTASPSTYPIPTASASASSTTQPIELELPSLTFVDDIWPLWQALGVQAGHGAGSFVLRLADPRSAYNNVINVTSQQARMSLIQPCNASQSYLYRKLAGTHLQVGGLGAAMPLGGADLSEQQLANVATWIMQGARFDSASTAASCTSDAVPLAAAASPTASPSLSSTTTATTSKSPQASATPTSSTSPFPADQPSATLAFRLRDESYPLLRFQVQTRVQYKMRDRAGNEAQCSYTARLRDVCAPSISCSLPFLANSYVQLNTLFDPSSTSFVTATDLQSPLQLSRSPPQPFSNATADGTYELTFCASDGLHAPACCVQQVTLQSRWPNSQPPQLVCPPDSTVEASGSDPVAFYNLKASAGSSGPVEPQALWWQLGGHAQASGWVGTDGIISAAKIPVRTSALVLPQIVAFTLHVRDRLGEVASCFWYVTVRDTTPPTIDCSNLTTLQLPSYSREGRDVAVVVYSQDWLKRINATDLHDAHVQIISLSLPPGALLVHDPDGDNSYPVTVEVEDDMTSPPLRASKACFSLQVLAPCNSNASMASILKRVNFYLQQDNSHYVDIVFLTAIDYPYSLYSSRISSNETHCNPDASLYNLRNETDGAAGSVQDNAFSNSSLLWLRRVGPGRPASPCQMAEDLAEQRKQKGYLLQEWSATVRIGSCRVSALEVTLPLRAVGDRTSHPACFTRSFNRTVIIKLESNGYCDQILRPVEVQAKMSTFASKDNEAWLHFADWPPASLPGSPLLTFADVESTLGAPQTAFDPGDEIIALIAVMSSGALIQEVSLMEATRMPCLQPNRTNCSDPEILVHRPYRAAAPKLSEGATQSSLARNFAWISFTENLIDPSHIQLQYTYLSATVEVTYMLLLPDGQQSGPDSRRRVALQLDLPQPEQRSAHSQQPTRRRRQPLQEPARGFTSAQATAVLGLRAPSSPPNNQDPTLPPLVPVSKDDAPEIVMSFFKRPAVIGIFSTLLLLLLVTVSYRVGRYVCGFRVCGADYYREKRISTLSDFYSWASSARSMRSLPRAHHRSATRLHTPVKLPPSFPQPQSASKNGGGAQPVEPLDWLQLDPLAAYEGSEGTSRDEEGCSVGVVVVLGAGALTRFSYPSLSEHYRQCKANDCHLQPPATQSLDKAKTQ
eukprot:g51063.t1